MKNSLEHLVPAGTLPLNHRVRDAESAGAGAPPCLLLLHGVGANELGFIELAQRLDPRLVVVLARGPLAFGPQQFGWFQVSFTATGPVPNLAQAEQSRLTLIDFIAGLPAAYGVDPANIWVGGFSQGGIVSASVGLTQPDLVAGFAILSGRILPEIAPLTADVAALRGLHAFVSHGVYDSKLPIAFGRNSEQLLREKEVQLTYREYEADHELNGAMQHDFGQWLTARIDA